MDTTPLRLLVDTNVWCDLFIPSRPCAATSASLIQQCSGDDVLLVCSSHSLQDVVYAIAKDAKAWARSREDELTETWAHAINTHAWDCVRRIQELGAVASMGPADVWLAEKYQELHPDFEDDLVIAVAQRIKADYLVTNDRQLIAKAPVAALTPADALAVLKARG